MSSTLTTKDFLLPEFRNADPAEYERRPDGVIVRKDRWETGIRAIARAVGFPGSFEVDEVVAVINAQLAENAGWCSERPDNDLPTPDHVAKLKLADGTTLVGIQYSAKRGIWTWPMANWTLTALPEGASWSETKFGKDVRNVSDSYRFAGLLAEWCATSMPPIEVCSAWLDLITKGHSPAEANDRIPTLVDWVRERAGRTPFKSAPEMMLVLCLQTLHKKNYE